VSSYAELLADLVKKNVSLDDLPHVLQPLKLKDQHLETILFFWKTENANVGLLGTKCHF
jgi:hypothetical protein